MDICPHFLHCAGFPLQAAEELSKVGGISKILLAENDAYNGFLAGKIS